MYMLYTKYMICVSVYAYNVATSFSLFIFVKCVCFKIILKPLLNYVGAYGHLVSWGRFEGLAATCTDCFIWIQMASGMAMRRSDAIRGSWPYY